MHCGAGVGICGAFCCSTVLQQAMFTPQGLAAGNISLPWRPETIVIDVSFIGLEKVLGPVLACAAPVHDCLAMVKPQFQLGPGRVGKGGVVRDAADRREAIRMVVAEARELGASVVGIASSGLPGPRGNRETFLHLADGGRREMADVEAAIRAVEP